MRLTATGKQLTRDLFMILQLVRGRFSCGCARAVVSRRWAVEAIAFYTWAAGAIVLAAWAVCAMVLAAWAVCAMVLAAWAIVSIAVVTWAVAATALVCQQDICVHEPLLGWVPQAAVRLGATSCC